MLKLCLQPGLNPAGAASAGADAADGAAPGGKAKAKAGSLPRMLFYDDLETLNATSWLGFERVLLVQNRCVRRREARPAGVQAACKVECVECGGACSVAPTIAVAGHRLPACSAGMAWPAGAAALPTPSTPTRSGKQHMQVGGGAWPGRAGAWGRSSHQQFCNTALGALPAVHLPAVCLWQSVRSHRPPPPTYIACHHLCCLPCSRQCHPQRRLVCGGGPPGHHLPDGNESRTGRQQWGGEQAG